MYLKRIGRLDMHGSEQELFKDQVMKLCSERDADKTSVFNALVDLSFDNPECQLDIGQVRGVFEKLKDVWEKGSHWAKAAAVRLGYYSKTRPRHTIADWFNNAIDISECHCDQPIASNKNNLFYEETYSIGPIWEDFSGIARRGLLMKDVKTANT